LLFEGIPFYNDLRQAYGLPRRTFDQITRDQTIVSLMRQVYGDNVDIVDAFVGGLAEGLFIYLFCWFSFHALEHSKSCLSKENQIDDIYIYITLKCERPNQ
jgi:hypothetical protein